MTLPVPPHFDPARAEDWGYRPDVARLFADALEWRRAHALTPSGSDGRKRHLLLIDCQRDFCYEFPRVGSHHAATQHAMRHRVEQ